MANEQAPAAEKKPRATQAAISKATADVASKLADFYPDEQARIIRAAAAINGLEGNKGGKR